jgi:hypothetical protein
MQPTSFAVLAGCILFFSATGVTSGEAEKMIAVARCSRESACAEALDECLGELGAEDCDRELAPVTRIAACQPKILCAASR